MRNKIILIFFILGFYIVFFVVKSITLFCRLINLRSIKNKPKKDVLYLEGFPYDGSGYQYRVRRWKEIFKKEGYKVDSKTLIKDSDRFFKLINPDRFRYFLIISMVTRLFQLFTIRNYETVIVRRNLILYNSYGALFFEKLMYEIHPNLILDIDDDLSAIHQRESSFFSRLMMEESKYFEKSLSYYKKFIVGSHYLKGLIMQENDLIKDVDVCIIPTCVDYDKYKMKRYEQSREVTIFGWIGGNQNLHLLEKVIKPLNILFQNKPIELHVISGMEYHFDANFPVKFIKWSLETEVEELKKIDVGIMPINDDKVGRGKCGFKLLQYMGVGVPGIASAVTINNQIIDDNENGWLVRDESLWLETLEKAIDNKARLATFGKLAQNKVLENYSFIANQEKYQKFIFKNGCHH
jgi:glycosyltransferase involved in cell wall biosynthesis